MDATPEAVSRLARAVATRHGVPADGVRPEPRQGVANHTLAIGPSLVLRVARPDTYADLRREAAVLPAAAAAGLPVPEVVEAPASAGDGAPPYLLLRRCHGVRLDGTLEPGVRDAAYRSLGEHLRRLHAAGLPAGDVLVTDDGADPRHTLQALLTQGWLDVLDACWLHAWFDRLGASCDPAEVGRRVVVHGDASPSNVLVDPHDGHVTALLDWGDTARAAPASDLAKVPPVHLPEAVAGYAGDGDEQPWAAMALWHHLAWAVGRLPTTPRPRDPTWSAAPSARLLGVMRLVQRNPGGCWPHLLMAGPT